MHVQRLVSLEGYFLDGEEACAVAREPVYKVHKLEAIQAETKYTDNRIIVRLADRHQMK